MVRFVIIGIVIAVAFTLYALVDAAMTDSSRSRGVSKPLWVVIVAVLPVIGAILWFTIGKGSGSVARAKPTAPDDDPRFTGTSLSNAELDAHMQDLEDRLRELDDEVYPGENRGDAGASTDIPVEDSSPYGTPEEPVAGQERPRDPAADPDAASRADGEAPREAGTDPDSDENSKSDEGDPLSGGDAAQR